VIDGFLNLIDRTLPTGWVRDSAVERSSLRPDCSRCYLFDKAGDAAVRVWLQRVTPTRVRGGTVQLLRHPPSTDSGRLVRMVAEFSDHCVLPAARTAGVRYTRPAFGPRSALTSAGEILFTQFADSADGDWPLTGRAQESWDELVSGCLAERVAIDRDELVRWLTDNGWEQKAVTQIADRFFAESELLAKRLAVAAP
jgi:hypothetical protein